MLSLKRKDKTVQRIILDRNNLNKAYLKVKRNGGSAGIDGMTVDEMLPYLKEHREELLCALRSGKYNPKAVRRVEIPKPDGGKRKLGVPTVIDRMIQQAIVQVLQILDCVSETVAAEMRTAYKVGFKDGAAMMQEIQD